MTSFPEYQQQFVDSLLGRFMSTQHAEMGMLPPLQALVNALPYYCSYDFETAHRGALSTLLQLELPNSAIKAQPDEIGFGYNSSYTYNGPYSGYADAFFHTRTPTAASAAVAEAVQAVSPGLTAAWWQEYSVAVLTDAAQRTAGVVVDTGKLSKDLTDLNGSLQPALSATCLATLETGYQPTACVLKQLASTGQAAQALAELTSALDNGQFTANVNAAISRGGDATTAAVWFLYILWITLKALNCTNVDAEIQKLQAAGLLVPLQVGPQRWWNGGYTGWYIPLSGTDVAGASAGLLNAALPEMEISIYDSPGGAIPLVVNKQVSAPKGYAQSLCHWGGLNRYKPQSSSCFGAGTGVLMADGSVKAIEHIAVGEEVMSDRGVGRVTLVERLDRSSRPLYSVNGLHIWATSGHPFRTADQGGPLHRAIDPWHLMDTVPTVIAQGVGALAPGVTLAGVGSGGPQAVIVSEVTTHNPTGHKEFVYDLLVDNGGEGYGIYHVGGPDIFLAVDAETPDALYDIPSTAGVASALDTALSAVRKHLGEPFPRVRTVLAGMDPPVCKEDGRSAGDKEREQPPDADQFRRHGQWDEHVSALGTELVRQFGRAIRRRSWTGWCAETSEPTANDRLTVLVHDIELLGDVRVDGEMELELRLRSRDTEDCVRRLGVGRSRWHLAPDAVVDFGRVSTRRGSTALVGTLWIGTRVIGRFRIPTCADGTDHFLFDAAGAAVGRITVRRRRLSPTALASELARAISWTSQDAEAVAVGIGRRLGRRVTEMVTPRPADPGTVQGRGLGGVAP